MNLHFGPFAKLPETSITKQQISTPIAPNVYLNKTTTLKTTCPLKAAGGEGGGFKTTAYSKVLLPMQAP